MMTDVVATIDVPRGALDWRHGHLAVIVAALRAGSEDAVTIE
jgi:hypothetical protein